MRAGAAGGSGARNFSLLVAFAAAAAGASAQEPFVKVGPETVYDAGIRCAVPFFEVADFDRDGRQDFVLGNTPSSNFAPGGKPGALMVWMAQPDGSFSEQACLQRRAERTPEAVQDIAWKAQKRLCARYRSMEGRGKLKVQACTAVARELAGFIWAIGQALPPPATPAVGQ